VKVLDANLLIPAYASSHERHSVARPWVDALLSSGDPVGLPWPTLLAFLRIVTNPKVFASPASIDRAWQQVEEWLAVESVWVPLPTERHAVVLSALMPHVGKSARVPDAHLAAIAIEHGLELCSADGDFERFPGLKWSNPFADG
jgi:toxin-antitoxin system PIN domain toxin